MPYPTVPSRRMAWDDDGTLMFYRTTTSVLTEKNATDKANANDESDSFVAGDFDSRYVIVCFPELREFDGFFISAEKSTGANPNFTTCESSGDSTNTYDGTWNTDVASISPDEDKVYTRYRDGIVSTARSNVRMIRIFQNNAAGDIQLRGLHIYGEISSGQTPDRLLWVDNGSGSEFALPIDYGDIPRGSAEDREVKLRNNSGTLTAATVQITAEDLYLGSSAWYTFAEAGIGTFQATLQLSGSISNGADSPVITVRRNTPDTETLGAHAGRAQVSVGSWS